MKTLFLILGLAACVTPTTIEPTVTVDITSDLNYHNGYYYLPLNEGQKQTLVKLRGTISVDGQPVETTKAYWNNNLRWTLVEYARVVIYGFNDTFKTVPTINSASYSNAGEVYTMIGPIYEMVGDTMTVVLSALNNEDTIKIILQ